MKPGLAAIGFVAVVALAGCGGGTETVTTTAPAETEAGATTETEAGTETTPAQTIELGEPKVLTGVSDETLKFTPLTFIDPVQPGQYDQPDPGQRLVGVTWEMTNVGNKVYDSASGTGAVLILTDGTQVEHVITGSSTAECNYVSEVKLAPGETAHGCLPFQIGEEAEVKEFHYAVSSGYGGPPGVWSLSG